MSGAISLYGAGQFLSAMFGQSATPPQDYYVALIGDTPPSPYLNGEELDEPTAASYARAVVPNLASVWELDGNVMVNVAEVAFAPAVEDWGRVSFWALTDAAVGGQIYAVGDLDVPVTVLAGDEVVMPVQAFAFELGTFFNTPEA